jgi:hypothetical protein
MGWTSEWYAHLPLFSILVIFILPRESSVCFWDINHCLAAPRKHPPSRGVAMSRRFCPLRNAESSNTSMPMRLAVADAVQHEFAARLCTSNALGGPCSRLSTRPWKRLTGLRTGRVYALGAAHGGPQLQSNYSVLAIIEFCSVPVLLQVSLLSPMKCNLGC